MKTPMKTLLPLALACVLAGCWRGGISDLPPVHLVLDMDFQPKLKAQSHADFAGWTDGRGMRLPVTDANGKTAVVARDSLPDGKLAHKDANGAFVTQNPVALTAAVLRRGQERFDIHCAVCHGYSGQGNNNPISGHGLVGRRWPVAIPTFHYQEGLDATLNRVALLADGEYFDVMTNGKTTMPAYGARIGVEDRWAIVHYLRALQRLSK